MEGRIPSAAAEARARNPAAARRLEVGPGARVRTPAAATPGAGSRGPAAGIAARRRTLRNSVAPAAGPQGSSPLVRILLRSPKLRRVALRIAVHSGRWAPGRAPPGDRGGNSSAPDRPRGQPGSVPAQGLRRPMLPGRTLGEPPEGPRGSQRPACRRCCSICPSVAGRSRSLRKRSFWVPSARRAGATRLYRAYRRSAAKGTSWL